MIDPLWSLMGTLYKAHPWHGIPLGPDAPKVLTAYIEIVPTDTVKYELDKATGHLKLDRPQIFSNICPCLYGLVPQTLCGSRVADLAMERTARSDIVGDDDPLDICVLTEKDIAHGDILLQAIPIGGFRMIDHGEADDKIVAVLKGDAVYGGWKDLSECPRSLTDRLRHYFLTYKQAPGEEKRACEITHVYGREEAHEVIRRSREDYNEIFSGLENLLTQVLRNNNE
jgi:inorganic pyrophosphatase